MRTKQIISSLSFSYKSVWGVSRIGLTVILTTKIILGFLPLLSVWLFENLFDSILAAVKENAFSIEIMLYLAGLAGTVFFAFAFNKFTDIVRSILIYKFEVKMKGKLFNSAKDISYINYEDPRFQNSFLRAFTGQKNIISVVDSSTTIIQTTISLISVLIYLINISKYFLILLFVMVIPLIFIETKYGKQRFNLSKGLVERGRKENYFESLLIRRESLKEIRINNLENFFILKWQTSYIKNAKEKIKLDIKQTKWLFLANLLLFISFIGSGTYVYYLMVNGLLTIGALAAVLQAIQRLQGIVPSFTGSLSNFYEYTLHVREFINFLPPINKCIEEKETINSLESIEATNLTFYYPDKLEPSLDNLNLSIKKGKKTAIIGGNGAGKTTLVKCLTGLYDTNDMIKINTEYDISKIIKKSYWDKISVLFQDFNKYDLTVKENIGMTNLDKLENKEAIAKYMKYTGLHTYVEKLPLKYNSVLGRLFNGGQELSGGQWQKLAIARALFKEGDILFLDEPTSALDPESELFVIENLFEVIGDLGVVYITHRINVAMLADEIILMENGRIIEQGSHERLVKQRGRYFELYNKQIEQLKKRRGGVSVG
ncbi:MAG: ABC transporter ATP-binding protein [Bacillota bacterium]|uniref:ABC transporter ATP-binding protein n=1 Tax=Virgibacillus salarius TaxID=447199 RepID=A0A941IB62_9BACI|nr:MULTISPECIES: ABC transporter ATP-binding protein [Virgibacillus]MBR7796082.1 ABC transporter ATP-binding protein [Virgibacillus salarius]MCC2250428.1 ABC transporter ATP-binding protein/permease [Virgibacillus sp. AGTR]NAZ08793.1 ATP-binding cassette domain-containing protein [Agaribacter marinus]